MGERLDNIPLKATFYARVSTDSDIQLNSLDNQLDYYKQYILSRKNWKYVPGYVDEGVTGTRVDKRKGFKKMIDDASRGQFDLIITKEVSRFARDLEDSIHYIRKLKEYGVGILFENQNLNTFDANSELILNIMFNLAQDESRKMSARIKFGHQQAIKQGHVLGSSNITGYRKENCKLVIVDDEAKFIRKMFELYATGEYGLYKLGWKLKELGYYNKKGKIYDKDSLKRMISNPKYKGYYHAKEMEVIDYRTKKRKKNLLHEQVLYKDTLGRVPAIVSEELWDMANKILQERTKSYQNNNYWSGGVKYAFSGKLYCQEHIGNFSRSYRDKNKNKAIWACSKYLKYRVMACQSPIILEEDLYIILHNVYNKLIKNKLEISNYLQEFYNAFNNDNNYVTEQEKINKKILMIEDKKQLLLDLIFKGEIDRDSLKEQFRRLDKNTQELIKEKEFVLEQDRITRELFDNNRNLRDKIIKILDEEILDDLIREFVEKIIVSKIDNNRHKIRLDIYLNLFNSEINKLRLDRIIRESVSKRKIRNYFWYFVYIR